MSKRLQKIFGTYKIEKVHIVPYRSYGTPHHLYIKGRVLDNPPLEMPEKQSFWQTVKTAIKQFDTHEIANIKVMLAIGAISITTNTDRKGYFIFNIQVEDDLSLFSDKEGWVNFDISVMNEPQAKITEAFKGEFLIPEKEADFGIITDIDDTILNTGVTSFLKWKILFNSFFVNAYRRIPLEGAPDLYRKLHLGVDNKEKNPVFYLSNSPWNLYQYLQLFLDHNKFPRGPVLLRTFNSMFQRVASSEKPHKQKEIFNLLETYPELKFILIGDSGEHDATIYTDIAAQFPDRILCIYLRSVNHKGRMRSVRSIVDNFRTTPIVLVESSRDAESHARSQGYL